MVANHVNNSDIRLAVVGFGGIAQKHIAAFRSFGVKIVAAANRSPEGRRNAEQNGAIERTYADAERMVEEAVAAGCDQIIIVTGRGKSAIEDHFDVSYELEKMLE